MKKIISIIFLCAMVHLSANSLQEAFLTYQEAEKATSVESRAHSFNQALRMYLDQDVLSYKHHYNIANCYYNLNQSPLAIWHYKKALENSPRDVKIRQNLAMAYKAANIEIKPYKKVLENIFFIHTKLAPQEKTVLLYLSVTLALTFFILALGIEKKIFNKVGSLFAFFGLLLAVSHFSTPFALPKAIITQAAIMKCDSGEQYKEVKKEPEIPGSQVRVLSISQDQKWAKIKGQDSAVGYILVSSLKLL